MNGHNPYNRSLSNAIHQNGTSSVHGSASQARLPGGQPSNSASSYANLDYLFGVQEVKMNTTKTGRSRRRPSDPSHVKHRRTRSGCYTCRSRRVKCDEGRPTCERCKKGSRDCAYPEQSGSSKAATGRTDHLNTEDSRDWSSGDEDGDAAYEALDPIPDVDEELDDALIDNRTANSASASQYSNQQSRGAKASTRQGSETPSLIQDKGTSPTPSTESSIGYSSHQGSIHSHSQQHFPPTSGQKAVKHRWAQYAPDIQFYLAYFYENITYMHYSFKYDPNNFLQTDLLETAFRNEALLYGIVGFSAFQYTLHQPDGKIEHFLPYYNKAVSLLLSSLKRGEKHSIGILMAILQLTTIEEFLGDWVNLLGHQKAAYEIINEIYEPHNVMDLPLSRTLMDWYMRFDVFAGLLGGFQTVLSREWFTTGLEFYAQRSIDEPDVLDWKIHAHQWRYRLLAMDMSLLFARMGKGEISPKQFEIENTTLSRRFAEWNTHMDPALRDPRYLVHDFSNVPTPSDKDVVDPWRPGYFYDGPLYAMNIATLDWLSITTMHKYQTAQITQTAPGPELLEQALRSCQLYEAIEFWPQSPKGTILSIQPSLGISLLFLPRDDKHAMWGRRKFASIEANGYIYPYTFRSKFAELFRDPACMHWWLPNNENYPTIVRSIRKFVEERTAPAKDTSSEDLRDMKTIFSQLSLDEGQEVSPKDENWI